MTEAQSKAYDRCFNMMGLYDTVEGQRKALEMYKDDLAPDVYEEFKAVLDVLAENPETQAAEKEAAREKEAAAKGYGSAAEYDAAVLEGKEYVEYEGASYKVNGEAVSSDGMVIKDKGFLEALKAKGFNNPYDKKIPNGTTLTFKIKPIEDGKFTWQDVVAIVGAGFGVAGIGGALTAELINYNMTLTYYNGEWYPTKKQ